MGVITVMQAIVGHTHSANCQTTERNCWELVLTLELEILARGATVEVGAFFA